MEDRVGSKIPTSMEVIKLVKDIQSIGDRLAAYTIDLTPEERQRTLKFRPGGERIVQLVSALAVTHQVALPKVSVAGMLADLELYARLEPVAAALTVLSKTIADTMLEAHSECWWAATAYYTTLARLAAADPRLVRALRPAVEFFAVGKRAPKPKPSLPSTTSGPLMSSPLIGGLLK